MATHKDRAKVTRSHNVMDGSMQFSLFTPICSIAAQEQENAVFGRITSTVQRRPAYLLYRHCMGMTVVGALTMLMPVMVVTTAGKRSR